MKTTWGLIAAAAALLQFGGNLIYCVADETCADYTDACTTEGQGPALDDVACTGVCDEGTCCVSDETCADFTDECTAPATTAADTVECTGACTADTCCLSTSSSSSIFGCGDEALACESSGDDCVQCLAGIFEETESDTSDDGDDNDKSCNDLQTDYCAATDLTDSCLESEEYIAWIECFVENWTGCSIDGTCSSNGTMVSFVDALKFAVFGAAAATAAAALAGLQLF